MRSIIFANYMARDTMKFSPTCKLYYLLVVFIVFAVVFDDFAWLLKYLFESVYLSILSLSIYPYPSILSYPYPYPIYLSIYHPILTIYLSIYTIYPIYLSIYPILFYPILSYQ